MLHSSDSIAVFETIDFVVASSPGHTKTGSRSPYKYAMCSIGGKPDTNEW